MGHFLAFFSIFNRFGLKNTILILFPTSPGPPRDPPVSCRSPGAELALAFASKNGEIGPKRRKRPVPGAGNGRQGRSPPPGAPPGAGGWVNPPSKPPQVPPPRSPEPSGGGSGAPPKTTIFTVLPPNSQRKAGGVGGEDPPSPARCRGRAGGFNPFLPEPPVPARRHVAPQLLSEQIFFSLSLFFRPFLRINDEAKAFPSPPPPTPTPGPGAGAAASPPHNRGRSPRERVGHGPGRRRRRRLRAGREGAAGAAGAAERAPAR